MKNTILTLTLLFAYSTNTFAQDFSAFSQLLKSNIIEKNLLGGGYQTSFNYTQANSNPQTAKLLKTQKLELEKFDVKTLKDKETATAFWINSYNFFMIDIIISQGFEKGKLKINSVKDLGSFFSPYKIFKKEINNIGGKNMSLDDIEKGILLGEGYKKLGWKDARIHFAVNCASVGCPPLVPEIYTAKTLDKTLDTNIVKALKTKRHFDLKDKVIYLTHLFKWYKEDFKEHSGSIKEFLKKYITDNTIKTNIDDAKDIEHIEYNWKLNQPSNF